ncbi:MAG: hypothetical protein V4864_12380 [Pseudomonadota bacterium]
MPVRSRLCMTTVVAALLALAGPPAFAQDAARGVSVDGAGAAIRSAFDGLARWVSATTGTAADAVAPPPAAQPQPLPNASAGRAPPVPYEPWPVILGEPALPLAGATAASLTKGWNPALNYQGMQAKLLVLDASGKRHVARPLSAPLRVGERFKLMVTPTFDAVASLHDIHGNGWALQRGAQVYPAAGSSVALTAGQPALLPVGANYFVVGARDLRRFVLSVRHAKAVGEARSTQPAYRQDGAAASSYLQLVPRSSFPAFEQLLVAGNP